MSALRENSSGSPVGKNKAPEYGLLQEDDDTTYLASGTMSSQASTASQEADDTRTTQPDPHVPQSPPYHYNPYAPPANPAYPPPATNPAYPPGPYPPPQGYYGMQGTHSSTTVIVQQPGPPQVVPPRGWTSQLCECGRDWSICCCGLFCLCCLECNVAQDMDESCMLPCCVPGWLITLRTKMRIQENISGSVMDDCCHVCCCYGCSLCQLAYEIKVVDERRQAAAMAMRQIQM